jgi:hypothetical protein
MIEQLQESQIKQFLVTEYDEEDWEFSFINFENNLNEYDRFNQPQVYEDLTDEEIEMREEWLNARGD